MAVESPGQGQRLKPWTREGRPLFRHPSEAGIPCGGAEQCVVATCTNHRGDSRAERENDVQYFQSRCHYPGGAIGGILRLLAQALNDVQELWCVPGCGVTVGKWCVTRVQWTRKPKLSVIQGGTPVPRGIPHAGAHAQQWTREGRPIHRHPREAGIPRSGAWQYDIATVAEPFGGFPRGARE